MRNVPSLHRFRNSVLRCYSQSYCMRNYQWKYPEASQAMNRLRDAQMPLQSPLPNLHRTDRLISFPLSRRLPRAAIFAFYPLLFWNNDRNFTESFFVQIFFCSVDFPLGNRLFIVFKLKHDILCRKILTDRVKKILCHPVFDLTAHVKAIQILFCRLLLLPQSQIFSKDIFQDRNTKFLIIS
mgnify:CR=1 FL=1